MCRLPRMNFVADSVPGRPSRNSLLFATGQEFVIAVKLNELQIPTGVRLHYREAGRGAPLVLLPGWSQTAAMYGDTIETLSSRCRVIALDHRGHGESEKVDHGYHLARLAMDLRELILALDLEKITLLGHSMGAAVIFSYLELFGTDRLCAVILDDQPAALTLGEMESQQARNEAGAIFSFSHLCAVCTSLRGDDAEETTRRMLIDMLSPRLVASQGDWILRENMKLPRSSAAALLWDCALADWRNLLGQIGVPALVIGGKSSLVPWESQQWIAQQIPVATSRILEESEGGYHFAFLEQPGIFCALVEEFLVR